MKRALTSIAAAALLAGVPLLASAHDDDDRGRGSYGHGRHYHDHDWKRSKHVHHYYHHDRHYHVPPRVVHHHHHDHGPRIIERPVYVPVAPPPHVSVRVPLPHADVGFRLFF
jgi:Ni/Co efflux regulator RcnB